MKYDYVNDLYKKVDSYWDFFEVDGLKIPFNNNWKKIAVNLSGGADSACLTYLLCKHIEQNNLDCKVDAISLLRCWSTRPWQREIGQNVFDKLKQMFPTIINERHVTFCPPEMEHSAIGHSIQTNLTKNPVAGEAIIKLSFNKYCAYTYKLEAVYHGVTANPPEVGEDIRVKERDLDLDNLKVQRLFEYWNAEGQRFFRITPFAYVQKDYVYKQYADNNILDLYNTTGSCEGDLKIYNSVKQRYPSIDAYTPGDKYEPCGECWWCQERAWAEQQYVQQSK